MTDELREYEGGRDVYLERDYTATPQQVWDCWTDRERLARWLGAISDPLGAAPARLRLGDGEDDWADVTLLSAEEPTLLELRWEYPGADSSVLRVEISELAPGLTRVSLEHRWLGDAATGYGAGWHAYLARLGALLAAAELPSWDEQFAAVLPAWRARASA